MKKRNKTVGDVHKYHRQREREKYVKNGANAFHTHELLELMLYEPLSRVNTNTIAHELLDSFPDVKLISATQKDMETVFGVGDKTSFSLKVGFDTTLRLVCDGLEKQSLDNAFRRRTFVYLRCLGKKEETVMVWYLTDKMHLAGETEYTGKMKHPATFAAEIASTAEKLSAKYVMLSHSHGEKEAVSSVEDIYVTEYMKKYLSETETKLLEHYIVSETDCAECVIPGDGENR